MTGEGMVKSIKYQTSALGRRGSALVMTLVVVASLAIFGLALLSSGMSGAKSVGRQEDDYRLSSAVESVAILAADDLWSGYLNGNGGAADDILSFRAFLDGIGVVDNGVGPPPTANQGQDLMAQAAIPGVAAGNPEFNNVNIDAMRVFRRDAGDSTQLYITVSASTNLGVGIVNPVLNRAVQQVYTIEPVAFEGFEYGILANNVNCVFCHTQVDSVDRFYNTDPNEYGNAERIKVGTLESLMVRHNMDGNTGAFNDYDSDSWLGGSLYVRGAATDHAGLPIADWSQLSMGGFAFDADGLILEDGSGVITPTKLSPAGLPLQAGENLYIDYPDTYQDMVDGNLPTSFPAPIPDNGGIDPITGLSTPAGAGNKMVDPNEFFAAAQGAEGAITAGLINVSAPGDVLGTVPDYASAIWVGNLPSISQSVSGNVILTGTEDNPISIDGMVAIEGDLMINGYVKGSGTLVVSGNIYVPTDLMYLDGKQYLPGDVEGNPTGPRTFGVAEDGTENRLGIAAGGNIMIGDFQRPSSLMEDINGGLGFGYDPPAKYETVDGDYTHDSASFLAGDYGQGWSFALAELSLFNRAEWAKTQPVLPGLGEDNTDPSTWTEVNPHYEAGYVPRYYGYGDGDAIPIYNKGDLYYDPATDNWVGDFEVPLGWEHVGTDGMGNPIVDDPQLTLADPTDPNDPLLYDAFGDSIAAISTVDHNGGWITSNMYKISVEWFEDNRLVGGPMNIDGLLYTNNAIFGLVNRAGNTANGQMIVNGALVASDLGLLVPGFYNAAGVGTDANVPGSRYATGLQLNYDRRVKNLLKISNPNQVVIKRTLWNPTANVL